MSKALSRVRALVSEIDSIQTQGRKSSSSIPLIKAIESVPVSEPVKTLESNNVSPIHPRVSEAPPAPAPTPTPVVEPEGKVSIQLTGKIAVQLQLEHTEEIVEVRQLGETIQIRFTDGKAIHLPLKSVA